MMNMASIVKHAKEKEDVDFYYNKVIHKQIMLEFHTRAINLVLHSGWHYECIVNIDTVHVKGQGK